MNIRVACWINKATDTHWEYVLLFFIEGNNVHTKTPEYYVYTCIAGVGNLNEDSGQIHAPAAIEYLV